MQFVGGLECKINENKLKPCHFLVNRKVDKLKFMKFTLKVQNGLK